jgi:hypothetical protein
MPIAQIKCRPQQKTISILQLLKPDHHKLSTAGPEQLRTLGLLTINMQESIAEKQSRKKHKKSKKEKKEKKEKGTRKDKSSGRSRHTDDTTPKRCKSVGGSSSGMPGSFTPIVAAAVNETWAKEESAKR